MKSLFNYCLLFIISVSSIKAQVSDTTIKVRNNDFLKKIINSKEYVYLSVGEPRCILPFDKDIFSEKGQILYKTPKNLYIRLDATGFLFKMINYNDSIVEFNRIDHTVNFNYNIAAYSFSNGEDLYNYGGYGFWKNNGTLRKFNFKSKEWMAEPCDKEVINQFNRVNNAWFDPIGKKLYIPFETIVNDGLKDNEPKRGKVNDNSFILDLETMTWQNNGNANAKAMEIIRNSEIAISTRRGLMVLFREQLYLIDFKLNKVFRLNDNTTAQNVLRLDKGQIFYHQGKSLHIYNPRTKITDSLSIDLAKFVPLPYPVIEPNFSYLSITLIAAFLISIIILYVRKMRRNKLAKERIKPAKPDFKINFSETEIALINMLVAKSQLNLTANIDEINYTLGVKDKNIGLQKKIRSDVFNHINEKYSIFSNSDNSLIKSIRSSSDKRNFEYKIDEEMIESITAYLDSNIQKK